MAGEKILNGEKNRKWNAFNVYSRLIEAFGGKSKAGSPHHYRLADCLAWQSVLVFIVFKLGRWRKIMKFKQNSRMMGGQSVMRRTRTSSSSSHFKNFITSYRIPVV